MDSADKATVLLRIVNQKENSFSILQDVTGFMVGSKSEHGGIIKDGAKMVNAVSNGCTKIHGCNWKILMEQEIMPCAEKLMILD